VILVAVGIKALDAGMHPLKSRCFIWSSNIFGNKPQVCVL